MNIASEAVISLRADIQIHSLSTHFLKFLCLGSYFYNHLYLFTLILNLPNNQKKALGVPHPPEEQGKWEEDQCRLF